MQKILMFAMVIMLQNFAILVETFNRCKKNICIHIHVNDAVLLTKLSRTPNIHNDTYIGNDK